MENKKLIYSGLVVLLVVAGLWFYFSNRPEELASEKAAKLEIAGSSFEGEVMSISSSEAVIRSGKVERTEQGNQFVQYDKTISFADKIKFVSNGEEIEIELADIISYIKVGDKAVFYGSGNINSPADETFIVDRVELLSRAGF